MRLGKKVRVEVVFVLDFEDLKRTEKMNQFQFCHFPVTHVSKVYSTSNGNMRVGDGFFFFSTYCMSHITTQDRRSKSVIQESDYFKLCFSKDDLFSIQCFSFTTLDIYSINVKPTCSLYTYRLICKAKVMFTIYI